MPTININSTATALPTTVTGDPELTAKAKGLYAFLWSLEDGCTFHMADLPASFLDGRDGLRTATRELERYGYLSRTQPRHANGTIGVAVWQLHPRSRFTLEGMS